MKKNKIMLSKKKKEIIFKQRMTGSTAIECNEQDIKNRKFQKNRNRFDRKMTGKSTEKSEISGCCVKWKLFEWVMRM